MADENLWLSMYQFLIVILFSIYVPLFVLILEIFFIATNFYKHIHEASDSIFSIVLLHCRSKSINKY